MVAATDWRELAAALRELHRALVERSKRDFEREKLVILAPGDLLEHLTTDPYFEWLRGLSELMVDIDLAADAEAATADELSTAVRAAVEHFITAPASGAEAHAFAQRYWPYVQDDPHVAMSHAAVKRALRSWPRPQNEDAASLLHERHRLAEKARHRKAR